MFGNRLICDRSGFIRLALANGRVTAPPESVPVWIPKEKWTEIMELILNLDGL